MGKYLHFCANMRCLNLVDCNPVFYNYLNPLSSLAPNGIVRFGLEDVYTELSGRLLMELATRTHPDCEENAYALLMDSKHYFRRDLIPEYKGNRADKPAAYYTAKTCLRTLPHSELIGFEADDLIALAIAQHRDKFDKIRVYTVDSDIFQLVDHQVEVCLTHAHNPEYQIMDVASVGHWFTKRVIRSKTRTVNKVKIKYKGAQNKKEAKFWNGNCHSSITNMKRLCGDTSDNYPAHCYPVVYDLWQSPVHGANYKVEIYKTSEELHQSYWESLEKYRKKISNFIIRDPYRNPWVWTDPREDETMDEFGWDG